MAYRQYTRSALAAPALAFLITGCGGGGDDGPQPPLSGTTDANAAASCAALSSMKTSEFAVTAVAPVLINASADAPFQVPTTTTKVTSPFCRVHAVAKSDDASNINFELWLPMPSNWNGKFAGTASGGSAGSISFGTLAAHFGLNYASIAHDTGHTSTGFSQAWAFNAATNSLNMEQIVDWSSRSQHVVTVVGKQLTAAFYGSTPTHAYYNGCSASGHAGMMEAQRYPQDYDGIIAGAHTSDWTTNMATQAWVAYQQFGNGGAGAISKAQYVDVGKAVLAQCDGKPGVDSLVDGVLDDPRTCNFDPGVLQCTGASTDPATCLQPAQVSSLRQMYQGHSTTAAGKIAYPYAWEAAKGNYWPTNLTTPTNPQGSWADYFRYPVFENANYDFSTLNFDVDPLTARAKLRPIYDAYQTDLSEFRNRGGKLMMYHGWADSLISPYLTLDYYAGMRQAMGASEVDQFTRLYMIPGIDHCGGGTGTGNFSMMQALAKWVENGVAPDATNADNTVVASGSDGRTRPLCPYPQIARYVGTGDAMVASNFTCQAP